MNIGSSWVFFPIPSDEPVEIPGDLCALWNLILAIHYFAEEKNVACKQMYFVDSSFIISLLEQWLEFSLSFHQCLHFILLCNFPFLFYL